MTNKLISKVPDLLAARKWTAVDLIRRGFSLSTAYRLARGETGVLMGTAAQVVDAFGLSRLDDVFAIVASENGAE